MSQTATASKVGDKIFNERKKTPNLIGVFMRNIPKIKLKNGYFFIRISKKDYYLGKDKKETNPS